MTSTGRGRGLDVFREGDSPFRTLTFVRDLTPAELLTRMAVDPETLALRDAADLPDDLGEDLLDDENPSSPAASTARGRGPGSRAARTGSTRGS
ncbi:hypothetical protein OG237_41625 [Streptomyces zaomyceticus]|nr:hypothetical protein OG237_00430 [Streptomyces zaomyceticus]WSQ24014.1 hypothetical protein OG237_41625 [Streptomyces zaomyceticus]